MDKRTISVANLIPSPSMGEGQGGGERQRWHFFSSFVILSEAAPLCGAAKSKDLVFKYGKERVSSLLSPKDVRILKRRLRNSPPLLRKAKQRGLRQSSPKTPFQDSHSAQCRSETTFFPGQNSLNSPIERYRLVLTRTHVSSRAPLG